MDRCHGTKRSLRSSELRSETLPEGIVGRRWTDQDVESLKEMASRLPAPLIAEIIDRTVGAVAFKAHQLKLGMPTRKRQQEQDRGS